MHTFPASPHRRWYSLLIGLLLAAVLLKPVLAADCICVDTGHGESTAALATGGGDGCPGLDCHDGCAHVTAVVRPQPPLAFPQAAAALAGAAPQACRPLPTPGVFRPPIAG